MVEQSHMGHWTFPLVVLMQVWDFIMAPASRFATFAAASERGSPFHSIFFPFSLFAPIEVFGGCLGIVLDDVMAASMHVCVRASRFA